MGGTQLLVVKIELWPHGDESRARCLGKAAIALQKISSDGRVGSYRYHLLKWGKSVSSMMEHPKSNIWREGEVHGHDRIKRGPWDLLFMVLRDAVSSRVKDDGLSTKSS